jgi:hypothetical protein
LIRSIIRFIIHPASKERDIITFAIFAGITRFVSGSFPGGVVMGGQKGEECLQICVGGLDGSFSRSGIFRRERRWNIATGGDDGVGGGGEAGCEFCDTGAQGVVEGGGGHLPGAEPVSGEIHHGMVIEHVNPDNAILEGLDYIEMAAVAEIEDERTEDFSEGAIVAPAAVILEAGLAREARGADVTPGDAPGEFPEEG